MNNLKIILKDKTEVYIDAINYPANIIKTYDTKEELLNTWDLFTNENLSDFSVYEDDKETIRMTGYTLDSIQIIYNYDCSITVHFYFRSGRYQSVVVDEVKAAQDKAILDKVEELGGFQTKEEQSDKLGFDWVTEYLGDIVISRKYKEQIIKKGTKLSPFTYKEGMDLIEGAYYMKNLLLHKCTNGELVRESLLG